MVTDHGSFDYYYMMGATRLSFFLFLTIAPDNFNAT